MDKTKEQDRNSNPFKQLSSSGDIPENLRPRIMRSVTLAGVILEIAEMFTVNYVSVLTKLFSIENQNVEKIKKDHK